MAQAYSSWMEGEGLYVAVFTADGAIGTANRRCRALIRRAVVIDIQTRAVGGRSAGVRGPVDALAGPQTVKQIISAACNLPEGRRAARFPMQFNGWWGTDRPRRCALWNLLPPGGAAGVGTLIGLDVGGADDKAANMLYQSRAELQAIVDTAVDGIITISDRGIIEVFNPAAERLFGYSARQAIGKPVAMLMPQPFKSEHDGYIDRYKKTGHAQIIGIGREVTGRRKNGTTFPMFLSVGEQRLGTQLKFTGIVRDLTALKRAETEVLIISDRVQQRLGHDLHDGVGQLLTGAALHARALQCRFGPQSGELDAEMRRLVGLINDAIEQTRKISRGLQPLQQVADYVAALQSLASQGGNGIFTRIDVQAAPLPREAKIIHANNLFRIAQEALTNALRHGHPKNVEIASTTSKRAVTLTIHDNGSGIGSRGNAGLGLHIMDYRARLIGGQLTVSSRPPEGTTIACTVDCGIVAGDIDHGTKKNDQSDNG